MLSIYPAIFYHEEDGSYSAVFPDLNHLSTCGDTLDETISMAVDALAGYLYDLQLHGESLPTPTPLNQVDRHCEDDDDDAYKDEDIFVNMVSVDVPSYAKEHFNKNVKKTLSIPQWMNDMAVARKLNFSKILQNALKKELHIENA